MKCEAKVIAWACIAFLSLFATYCCVDEIRHRPDIVRREMRNFMARAQLGDTKAQVRQKFKTASYKVLALLEDPGDRWAINSPGLGNWILHLEFGQDKLRAMKLGTGDSPSRRPDGDAPPDKIAPGWP
jgi:hypothetical protein